MSLVSTSEGPSAAELRSWARAQGMDVGERGRLSPDVLEAWTHAHGRGGAPASPATTKGPAKAVAVKKVTPSAVKKAPAKKAPAAKAPARAVKAAVPAAKAAAPAAKAAAPAAKAAGPAPAAKASPAAKVVARKAAAAKKAAPAAAATPAPEAVAPTTTPAAAPVDHVAELQKAVAALTARVEALESKPAKKGLFGKKK